MIPIELYGPANNKCQQPAIVWWEGSDTAGVTLAAGCSLSSVNPHSLRVLLRLKDL